MLDVGGGGLSSSSSSSASGHKRRFSLPQLFGWRNQETAMKVSPWNQYQLMQMVDKEGSDSDKLQPSGSLKSRFFREFLSPIICIAARRKYKGSSLDSDPQTPPEFSADDSAASGGEGSNVRLKTSLKSSSERGCGVLGVQDAGRIRMKQVRWRDLCGEELAEIREFEFSDEEDVEKMELS